MPEPTIRRLNFRAPWVIFWVGFALRMACILIGHTYRIRTTHDHWEYGFEAGRIARSLVLGRGYSSPFNGPSGPTAWLPPLYPLLMALGFRLFGVYTNAAAIFIMACNSALSAAIAPALYEIAARCFDAYGIARRASTKAAPMALWSAWLWAVYPAALQFAIHWLWEMSLTACLFTWALVFCLRLRHIGEPEEVAPRPGRDFVLWAVFGLLWGLTALSNASLVLCLPVWILWILWPQKNQQSHHPLMQSVAGAALACIVIVATMMPWIVRNERAFHAFVPTRSNFGVELWQSSLPSHDAFPWGATVPLWSGDPDFKLYAKMGELNYAKMRGAQAKATLRAHPDVFLRHTLQRIQFFWFGVPHTEQKHRSEEVGRIFSYSFLSVAGLLGLALALKRRVPGAWLMASVLLLTPLVYYMVVIQARFRHPIEPIIAVLSVYLFRSTTPRKAVANPI
ncbi:hypothetical protein [Granulicella mallensis]|uniref:Glycosyltransferase RgtA/B/C/D-like domain-containing protein n=1 Tax=Granulicella mallensis TaxID=940614 RepID=A0A7W7ZSN2_9BACT|nr:hypothetical protein [Granulicella mallensis]MBB5065376.1 hypothetical protein [Granulicella mallensis]